MNRHLATLVITLLVTVTVTNSTMAVGQSQPATATANFPQASGIPVTSSVTNWGTSDHTVLTVNASGIVTAVGSGTATVNATVNGVTGGSSTITVPNSPPVVTQNPEASETLLVGATLQASISAIGNPPFIYRWYYNGGTTPISTATNVPTLTVPNVQMASAGSYTCVVSNQYGAAPASSALVLAVVQDVVDVVRDEPVAPLAAVGFFQDVVPVIRKQHPVVLVALEGIR